MSQFDLTQLSKKNQEFIRIAKHQLIENGKTEEEATSLIEEILPAIFENQPKGVTARTLFGAPLFGPMLLVIRNATKKSIQKRMTLLIS